MENQFKGRKLKIFFRSLCGFAALGALMLVFALQPMAKAEEGIKTPQNLSGKKILFVLTSHGEKGNSGQKTGYWLEELAAPYEILSQAGAEVVFASPKGGLPPVDPESLRPAFQTKETKKFRHDLQVQTRLADTKRLSEVKAEDFDAVFYPGGHGPLYDLVENEDSVHLIEDFASMKKPIAVLCHSPAVLKNVRDASGQKLIKGRKITAFSNSEEAASVFAQKYSWVPVPILKLGNPFTYKMGRMKPAALMQKLHLEGVIPFFTETLLREEGAVYLKKKNGASFVVSDKTAYDGILLSGQNPDSSALLGRKLREILFSSETASSRG